MGDQTFDRMYCDNTTGDSRLGGRPSLGGADSTADSLLPKDGGAAGGAEDLELEGVEGPAAAAEHGAASAPAAAASPAVSSGAPQRAAQAAAAPAAAQRAPNWTAPAFLPPYMQAPAASGAPSDHPALVHSPDVTGSSLNTLETRRVSVGVDMRRMSISSRRFSMQDATGRLLADFGGEDDVAAAGTAGLHEAAAQAALAAAAPAPAPASGGPRSRRRSSGAACEWLRPCLLRRGWGIAIWQPPALTQKPCKIVLTPRSVLSVPSPARSPGAGCHGEAAGG